MILDVRKIIGDSYKILFSSKPLIMLAIIGSLLNFGSSYLTIGSSQALSTKVSDALSAPGYLPLYELAGILIPSELLQILSTIISAFISGVIISYVYFRYSTSPAEAVQNAIDRYPVLLGALFLLSIPSFLVVVFLFLPKIIFGIVTLPFLLISFLLVIPIEYVIFKLIITAVEVVVEKKGVFESLRSSWRLTAGNIWGILFIVGTITVAANIVGSIFAHANGTAGDLVSYFLYYPAVIAPVLIYKQLTNPQEQGAVSFVGQKK